MLWLLVVNWIKNRNPELLALHPESPRYRRLDCAVQFEAAKIRNGFDKRLPKNAVYEVCASRGADEMQALLTFAIERDLMGAATAAAEILGEIGTAELLVQGGAEPAPLAKALQHPDRRLRFAAAEAIMKINPQRPYPGSSHLPEALGFFAGTSRAGRAVVGHPQVPQGHQLAALLSQLGYEAEAATSGRRLFELATQSADVELVLLHTSIDGPGVRETIYQLRSNAGTARVPIGIVASLERLAWARDVAGEDPRIEAFVRPHDVPSITAQLDGLGAPTGRHALSAEERNRQAAAALRWLGQLSSAPHPFYDLQRQAAAVETALYVPGLTDVAAATLAGLNMVDGQRILVDLAASPAMTNDDRQTAAAAFARSVQKYGILLTSKEILRQYDRYNASEFADKATQKLLASILDTIEGKGEAK